MELKSNSERTISSMQVADVRVMISHLLDVEKNDKFDNIDEGQQRTKQGPRPNHSLPVN